MGEQGHCGGHPADPNELFRGSDEGDRAVRAMVWRAGGGGWWNVTAKKVLVVWKEYSSPGIQTGYYPGTILVDIFLTYADFLRWPS